MVKILFVIDNLRIGGIQKALVNLLQEISSSYDVSLYLFNPEGELMREIPRKVKVIEAPKCFRILTVSQKQSKLLGIKYYILRMITATYTKIINNRLPFYMLFQSQKKITEYDVVISYSQSLKSKVLFGGCNEFVIQRARNCKKMSFVHCDMKNYEGSAKENERIYKKFDLVEAVSKACEKRLLEVIPSVDKKSGTIYNCSNFNNIKRLAKESEVYYEDGFHIVTVARLSEEKGLLRCLEPLKRLIDAGYEMKWHIVGGGPLKEQLQVKIKQLALDAVVSLEGEQVNPYRYLRNADLMFLPSYHEAAPMVFWEAACLAVPILTTNTVSAAEIVKENGLGWVCENSCEGIYDSLKELLDRKEQVVEKKQELSEKTYSNETAIAQFDQQIRRCLEGERKWS